MSALGAGRPKKTGDLTGKTDAELQATLYNLGKFPADKRSGIGGRTIGVLETSIRSELERRRLSKPPETPAMPDTTSAISNAQRVARDAAAKQRKRSAAGASGIVRPLQRGTGINATPVLSPTTLLGG